MSDERSTVHRRPGEGAVLPDEGRLASFARATGWLGSEPLTPDSLAGRVVLVGFWTYTCVNWLRTLPYLRAWNDRYAEEGLTIVGVHTPEFGFEADLVNVQQHVRDFRIDYPVALDNDYGVWDDFGNHYWPALYLADSSGRLRYHHFGEGEYAMTEMAIGQLLDARNGSDQESALVSVDPVGLEVAADWAELRSPETYLGYGQSSGFASESRELYDVAHRYPRRDRLALNSWDLAGNWTYGQRASVVNEAGGRVSFQFHARDANLVMAPAVGGAHIPYRVYLDGEPVGAAHGSSVGNHGQGVLIEPETYQLVRQTGPIVDRLVEVEFLEAGAAVYCFTFG